MEGLGEKTWLMQGMEAEHVKTVYGSCIFWSYAQKPLERRHTVVKDRVCWKCMPLMQGTAVQAATPCKLKLTNPLMDKGKVTVFE